MDSDDNEISEPSSSQLEEKEEEMNILQNSPQNSNQVASSNILNSINIPVSSNNSEADIINYELPNNYMEVNLMQIDEIDNVSSNHEKIKLNEVDGNLLISDSKPASITSEHVDEIEPGCSSSSSTNSNFIIPIFPTNELNLGSEALSNNCDVPLNEPQAHSSNQSQQYIKQADSNCLERSKGKGKHKGGKGLKGKQRFNYIHNLNPAPVRQLPNEAQRQLPNEAQRQLPNEAQRQLPNEQVIVNPPNKYSLFAKSLPIKPILNIDNSKPIENSNLAYDSGHSSDEDNSNISSVQTSSPRPNANKVLAFEEVVASSSESVQIEDGEIFSVRSPKTPGDSCLVSSSTGQLDSFPATPIDFQVNDVSNSSLISSPVHPPVLDSTVDSTSGQNNSSPYSDRNEESGHIHFHCEAVEDRNEISTSESRVQAILPRADSVEDSGEVSHSPDYVEQFNINSNSLDSNPEPSGAIPTSSAYLSDLYPLPEPSASRVDFNVPDNDLSSVENSDMGKPILDSSFNSSNKNEIPFQVGTSDSISMSQTSETLNMGSSSLEVPSSSLIAPSTSNQNEIFDSEPGCSSNQEEDQRLNDSEYSRTLTQINQGYMLGIDDSSLSNEAMVESQENLTRRELDDPEGSPNFQDSLELGLVPQPLAGRFDNRPQQSLVPPSNLLEECHQLESSNVAFIDCSQPYQTHDSKKNEDENSHGSSSSMAIDNNYAKDSTTTENCNNTQPASRPMTSNLTEAVSLLSLSEPSTSKGQSNSRKRKNVNVAEESNSSSIYEPISPIKRSRSSNISSQESNLTNSVEESSTAPVNIHSLFGNKFVNKNTKLLPPAVIKDQPSAIKVRNSEPSYDPNDPHDSDDENNFDLEDDILNKFPRVAYDVKSEATSSSKSDLQQKDGSGFWCSDCEKFLECKCSVHRVQTIMDKPIQSRAWASLPAQHLLIKQIVSTTDYVMYGVFCRKMVPKRTQFGPLEGIFTKSEPQKFSLVFRTSQHGHDGFIDVSNEGCSNWMRFVRPAETFLEMNCIVIEEESSLFFLTTMNLQPKTELRVGYSKQYAVKYGYAALLLTKEEQKELDRLRKSWSCYECDESFETSALLQEHLVCHDLFEVPEKKLRKRGRTKKVSSIAKRSKRNSTDNKKIKEEEQNEFECSYSECNLCFNSMELLDLHSTVHLKSEERSISNNNNDVENKSAILSCPECLLTCGSEDIGKHVKIHSFLLSKNPSPSTANPFKCSFCYKSYTTKERLVRHSSQSHQSESDKPFPCYVCSRRFCNKAALGSHLKFHQEGSLVFYTCPICEIKIQTVSLFKKHFPKHCVNGEYTCPTCYKKFESYFQIRRHIRSYHSAFCPCAHCGKQLSSIQKLRIHLAIHSDKREFPCPICPKKFKRKDKMKEHLKRLHPNGREEPKPVTKFVPKVDPTDFLQFTYKCGQCMLGFKRRGMLVNHMSKRHPDIPMSSVPELNQPILRTCHSYTCQYCEKTYASMMKRKLHILKNHPGSDLPPSGSCRQENGTNDHPEQNKSVCKMIKTSAASCSWCPRQYMTHAKLLQHQRKEHKEEYCRRYKLDKDGNILRTSSSTDFQIEYILDKSSASSNKSINSHMMNVVESDSEYTLDNYVYKDGQVITTSSINNHSSTSIAGPSSNSSSPGDDILAQALGGKFSSVSSASINGEHHNNISYLDQERDHGGIQITDPVIISNNNSSVPSGSIISLARVGEAPQPLSAIINPDGSFSLQPIYTVLSTASPPEVPPKAHNNSFTVSTAGPSTSSHHNNEPIDMRASVASPVVIESGSSKIIVRNSSLDSMEINLEDLKNKSCVLAQIQAPTGAGSPSILVWPPSIAFDSANL